MVLVKVNIRNNQEILNLDEVIEQLQRIKQTARISKDISLILKPIFYGAHASVGTIWTISGSNLEEAKKNPGLQNYDIFVKQNGALSHQQTFDDVLEDEDEET